MLRLLGKNHAEFQIHPESAPPPQAMAAEAKVDSSSLKNSVLQQLANVTGAEVAEGNQDEESDDLALHYHARNGNLVYIKHILDQQPSLAAEMRALERADPAGCTPLHLAARFHHYDAVRHLVERGSNVNACDNDGATPLHLACRSRRESSVAAKETHVKRYTHRNGRESVYIAVDDEDSGTDAYKPATSNTHNVVQFLASVGADVNACDQYDLRPLHYVSIRGNASICQKLLKCRGIEIDCRDQDAQTPLHTACLHGSLPIVRMLIDAGAELTAVDEEQRTPLHCAAEAGHAKIALVLLDNVDKLGAGEGKEYVSASDSAGNWALHCAAMEGHLAVVDLLCSRYDLKVDENGDEGNTPLHNACSNGSIEVIGYLLSMGHEMDKRNQSFDTPLHLAAARGNIDAVGMLLQQGAKLEPQNISGETPLLSAAKNGHAAVVQYLVEDCGVMVDARDVQDQSALYLAAVSRHTTVCQTLLASRGGAHLLEMADPFSNTPLHKACTLGLPDVVTILLQVNADVLAKNRDEKTALHLATEGGWTKCVQLLLDAAPEELANGKDDDANRPLHLAAMKGFKNVTDLLLGAGARLDAKNLNHWTPLQCAAAYGHLNIVKRLVEAGGDVNCCDKARFTPLHMAARNGFADVVEFLLDRDADVTFLDHAGNNCLDLAIENNRAPVAELLVQKAGRRALRNHQIINGILRTPTRSLVKKMPDVAYRVFDLCTQTANEPHDDEYSIMFDYEFIEDNYIIETETVPGMPIDVDEKVWNEVGKLKREARPYTDDKKLLKETHMLQLLVDSENERLLAHPLVLSLLTYKWGRGGKYLYYATFYFYAFFVFWYTVYAMLVPPPLEYRNQQLADGTWIDRPQLDCDEYYKDIWDNKPLYYILRTAEIILMYILVPVNLLRELYQFAVQRLDYISVENAIEIFIYISAFLLAFEFEGECVVTHAQWVCGAIGLCFAWLNLMLFMKRFPRMGIYMLMFSDVLRTFGRIFVIFSMSLISFALFFYMMLFTQEPFSTPLNSLMKTLIMVIGEMEFDDLVNSPDDNYVPYKTATLLIFTMFLLLLVVLMMNVLVGLSVDDIKGVQENAQLKKLAMQVQLVLDVEFTLPSPMRQRNMVKRHSVKPNQSKPFELVKLYDEPTLLSPEYIGLALKLDQKPRSQWDEKTTMNRVFDEQANTTAKCAKLEQQLSLMTREMSLMHEMLRAIAQQNNLDWQHMESSTDQA